VAIATGEAEAEARRRWLWEGLRMDEKCDAFHGQADNFIQVLVVVTSLTGEGMAITGGSGAMWAAGCSSCCGVKNYQFRTNLFAYLTALPLFGFGRKQKLPPNRFSMVGIV